SSPVYCETPACGGVGSIDGNRVPPTLRCHAGDTRTWPVPSAPRNQCALTTVNGVMRGFPATGGCGGAVNPVGAHETSGYSGYCLASFSTRDRRSFSVDASISGCNAVAMISAI